MPLYMLGFMMLSQIVLAGSCDELLLQLQNKHIIFYFSVVFCFFLMYVGVTTNFCLSPSRLPCLLLTFCLKRATTGSPYLYVIETNT